jgi:TRAP-type C4-dicarboxylate transport system permease small subunit
MPLHVVLTVLMAIDVVFIAATAVMGLGLTDQASMMQHYVAGMLTSMLTCFIHVLVLFYLIGTGKDIREAVEEDPDLKERYWPWTRRQKRRAFPPACFAIVLMIVATLMGGEVHSRLLVVDGGATLPFRGITAWWVHGALVVAAVLVSAWAFVVELAVARENRKGILEINAELERREREGTRRPL